MGGQQVVVRTPGRPVPRATPSSTIRSTCGGLRNRKISRRRLPWNALGDMFRIAGEWARIEIRSGRGGALMRSFQSRVK